MFLSKKFKLPSQKFFKLHLRLLPCIYEYVKYIKLRECHRMDINMYRFMDKLEIQVALAAIRIRLCSWLQIVPVVFCAVDILKRDDENRFEIRKRRSEEDESICQVCTFTTCS